MKNSYRLHILTIVVFGFFMQSFSQTQIIYHEHFNDNRMKWSEFEDENKGIAHVDTAYGTYLIENYAEREVTCRAALSLSTSNDFIFSYHTINPWCSIGVSAKGINFHFELKDEKYRINYTKSGKFKLGKWRKIENSPYYAAEADAILKIEYTNSSFMFYVNDKFITDFSTSKLDLPSKLDFIEIATKEAAEISDVYINGHVFLTNYQGFLYGEGIPQKQLDRKKTYTLYDINKLEDNEFLDVYKLKIDKKWDKELLPVEIFNCHNLQQVEIDGKLNYDYTKIIEQLAEFQYLSELSFRTYKLPVSISGLRYLKTLNMDNVQITDELLPELLKLQKLNSLDLSNDGASNNFTLEQLKNIGNLKELKYLNLERNELGSLPESIFKLTKLEYLNLSGNKLTTLPKSVKNFKKLKHLDLSYNFDISSLPPEIGSLKSLEYFDISGNIDNMMFSDLKEIPKEMGKLTNLQNLYFGPCEVQKIPGELANLKKLEYFTIQGQFSKEDIKKYNKMFSYVTELLIIFNEHVKF